MRRNYSTNNEYSQHHSHLLYIASQLQWLVLIYCTANEYLVPNTYHFWRANDMRAMESVDVRISPTHLHYPGQLH